MILVDTSVYISALTDKEVENKIREVAKKAVIMSSLVVEKEVAKSSDFLRKIGKKEDSERLKLLYNLSVGGKIGLTPFILKLSEEYADAVKMKFGKGKAKDMIEDFRIVSAASAAAIPVIATFNRKTMANEDVIGVYRKINEKYRLKTPKFITTKAELIRFLSSL